MPSFLVSLLLVIIIVVVILVLRKNQQKHTRETADRTAPLPALDDTLPAFIPSPVDSNTVRDSAAKANDNWQLQVKTLRESQQYDEALEVCRTQLPKAQAMQQAAIVLRQQLKVSQENNVDFEHLLQNLYNLAALADIYSGTRHTASALPKIMASLYDSKGKYRSMGYMKLKLLNKSDVRLIEQAWGKPQTHRHAEEIFRF